MKKEKRYQLAGREKRKTNLSMNTVPLVGFKTTPQNNKCNIETRVYLLQSVDAKIHDSWYRDGWSFTR